ncbi:MAG: YicC family protein [Sedimentisphaerales bacterium]|nr:YicC family protein [Sedimentisphaerales bacterium]
MISSMTGFGEAAVQIEGIAYVVEIRTVNNRYFKAQIRLPEIAAFLEGEIDRILRESVSRGTVNYSLRMKNISGQAFFDVDAGALRSYLDKLETLNRQEVLHCRVDLASMLSLPGVVQAIAPDETRAEQIRKVVFQLTDDALKQVLQMRSKEGKSLAADLAQYCDVITQTLGKVRKRSPIVVTEYHGKLRKRVDELMAQAKIQMDEAILAREVAIFADRSDIAEELARLESHLQQFRAECETDDKAGRKLDFICQELLREANTIASKGSDAQISQWVIEIKCAIDRIKEQVQNVE